MASLGGLVDDLIEKDLLGPVSLVLECSTIRAGALCHNCEEPGLLLLPLRD